MNITLTASKKTLILTPLRPAWCCARSRRVEFESETTIAVTAVMTAISAVHSWAARALFRLRKFVADGWHDHARNTEMLAAFGPTRPRSRSKALCRPIGTYDGTCLPARERQRTNWCHGSTEKSDHCFQSAVRRSPARRRRRWPKRAFFPLVTPLLLLWRSRGT